MNREAVIVATARSPIGRAGKGSLKELRPNNLAVQMIHAALAKAPQLNPYEIDDLMLGCGQPAGVLGFNWPGSWQCSRGWTTCPAPRSTATDD
ncbi:hypothetical protein Franean1_3005 [Parafrankia sp. EAN1pec]|nr:hypothetical protein Franean1_3005 [Frankia sp. EAN1pec]